MNAQSTEPTTKRASVTARIARQVRTALADSYFVTDESEGPNVLAWIQGVAADPQPIVTQFNCLLGRKVPPENRELEPAECYENLEESLLPAAARDKPVEALAWKVAAAPALTCKANCPPAASAAVGASGLAPPRPTPASPATGVADPIYSSEVLRGADVGATGHLPARGAAREMDAERFVANVMIIGPSLVEMEHIVGRPLTTDEITAGIAQGAAEAAAYIKARPLRRSVERPSTALVMSGGAATGAFTAGFAFGLLSALRQCRDGKTNYENCRDAKIDIALGTSTGSLVAVLTQLFHIKGHEDEALGLLVDKYTCSVESTLYCVNDELIWKLATNVRGLVQFNGIEGYLKKTMSLAPLDTSETELVTATVDYNTGDLYTISNRDPIDAADTDGRVQAVLASIVEPLMANPVDSIGRRAGAPYHGTFIDGGIRSGVPVLEAVNRGAERVIAISTSALDPDPIDPPPNVLRIVLRTIDLLVQQPRIGEVQQAEYGAVTRRMAEDDLCMKRFVRAGGDRDRFCKREFLFPAPVSVQGATTQWFGPRLFEQVARTWHSEWVYRPENPPIPGAAGYSFDPTLMRSLFAQGLSTFEARCAETLNMMNFPLTAVAAECAPGRANQVAEAARNLMKPIEACIPKERKLDTCER